MYINVSLFFNEIDYVLKWRWTKTNGGRKSNKSRQREEERVGERGKRGVNCCERKYRPYPPVKIAQLTRVEKHTYTSTNTRNQASLRREQPVGRERMRENKTDKQLYQASDYAMGMTSACKSLE